MPDYKNGKLYKLQCDDGHYYIGSTCNELRFRLKGHKDESTKERANNRRVYNHIKSIGGWTHVRIVLIEECPCENKQQLVRKEDEMIRSCEKDPLCLNSYNPLQTPEERQQYKLQHHRDNKERELEQYRQWVLNNREKRREYMKEYNKQYAQRKRDEKKSQQDTNGRNTNESRNDTSS